MKTQVLRGTKSEIAETVIHLVGEIEEVIVLFREPTEPNIPSSVDEMFAEMAPFTVDVADVDDSRQSIYTRLPGE